MRIIAGTARGRKLFTPANGTKKSHIRPTSDRAREALFSILGPLVEDAIVLDLFSGTGALGLEALSRGAQHALLVDNYQKAVDLIYKNINVCGFSGSATVLKRDIRKGLSFVNKAVPNANVDLVFLDPPYGKKIGYKILLEVGKAAFFHKDSVVVAEDYYDESMPDEIDRLRLFEQRRYGDTSFWFYRLEE